MGQYYNPISLTTFEWLNAHNYDNGLKLMEHSYIGNSFVSVIMKLLTKGEKWYKTRIVWCGDYSNRIFNDDDLYNMCSDGSGDIDCKIKLFNKINPKESLEEEKEKNCIIVNHSKKEYVKISECKEDSDKWIINPLPLLTALGNGQGGGDYKGNSMDLVGSWACDEISVEFDEKEFKDFTKINPNFEEGEEEGSNKENERKAYKFLKKWIKTDEVKKKLIIEEL